MLDHPLSLGSLTLPNRVFLAPLAGVSDAPFRRICQELGAGLTWVEMLSAVAVNRGNEKTRDMRGRFQEEPRVGVQVTGRTPEEVGEAVGLLDAEGFDTIDLNMGCPVRKVVATGCGSAILRDPARLSATVEAARRRTERPLSVKIRLGFDRSTMNAVDTAERVARAGADMLTVHGRTRSDRYDVPVDLEAMAATFRRARQVAGGRMLLVANGDVLDRDSAGRALRETGCDAVMVSRGALGNPWIFRELLDRDDPEPVVEEWLATIQRHVDYHGEFYGDDEHAAVLFRKHLTWYVKGFPGSRKLRDRMTVVTSLEEVRSLLESFAATLPADLPRFSVMPRQGPGHQASGISSPLPANTDA